jgi:ATP-dependent protease ClpP protease subunit
MTASTQPAESSAAFTYYCWLAGDITAESVAKITSQLSAWAKDISVHVHIWFWSEGGEVNAGINLYNFFRHYPHGLTVYAGMANSIAAVAFLGAADRRVTKTAKFVLHGVVSTLPAKTSIKDLGYAVRRATDDDYRVEAILQAHLHLNPAQWVERRDGELIFGQDDAIAAGFGESGSFEVPKAARLYYLMPLPHDPVP